MACRYAATAAFDFYLTRHMSISELLQIRAIIQKTFETRATSYALVNTLVGQGINKYSLDK